MSKCKKVKNPCKICLGAVTKRTGLQCHGACACWIHYACLNYTPGRIRDIKAGYIKVNCPCPDCKSTLPKEFRADEPYSCTNMQCPANQLPKCCNAQCPVNKGAPNKMNQTSDACAAQPCPLSKCGKGCKMHSTPNKTDRPRSVPCQPPQTPRSCPPPPCARNQTSGNYCSTQGDGPGSDQYSMDGMPSLGALEQMCSTVGHLKNQINCVIQKMRQLLRDRSCLEGCDQQCCTQSGPKALCPKPCFCPGNPCRRR